MIYPSSTPRQYIDDVNRVASLREVARAWHLWPKTIMLAINQNRVIARKLGKEWILSIASVRSEWGDPIERLERVYTLDEF